jgi:flavin-dependent dehydrogenase
MTKTLFIGKSKMSKELLSQMHTDVCGPMMFHAIHGYTYFITFTNNYSRYGYVYLMKYKSESFERFKEFRNEVEK